MTHPSMLTAEQVMKKGPGYYHMKHGTRWIIVEVYRSPVRADPWMVFFAGNEVEEALLNFKGAIFVGPIDPPSI